MILAAHSFGALMLIVFMFGMWKILHFDFDPEHCRPPEEMWQAIIPALSYFTLAWWLLFR